MKAARAYANANIALVKYWGKADHGNNVPAVSSLSMTLKDLGCKVTLTPRMHGHEILRNGDHVSPATFERTCAYLEKVRTLYPYQGYFHLDSQSSVPYASGLASSAAYFAALATALNEACDMRLDDKARSVLARMGSASAARSIFGGFAGLFGGSHRLDNAAYAHPLAVHHDMKLHLIVAVVDDQPKAISSRDAMVATKATSPFFERFVDESDADFLAGSKALLEGSFSTLGTIMEQSTLKMFATMWTATPAIVYWQPLSLAVINAIYALRREHGPVAFFTMDAGPNVKILCEEHNFPLVLRAIAALGVTKNILCTTPGEGALVVSSP